MPRAWNHAQVTIRVAILKKPYAARKIRRGVAYPLCGGLLFLATECDMAFSLSCCAEILSKERIRHHVDVEQDVIRVVFVTRHYRNLRGEKLAIAQIAMPDAGRRCRVTLERAFAPGPDAATLCLALCCAAAATPLVGVEFDPDCENVRMVVEAVVEDGGLTRRQLLSMVDSLLGAAEVWQAVVERVDRSRTRCGHGRKNVA